MGRPRGSKNKPKVGVESKLTHSPPERKRRDSKEQCQRCGKREVLYKTSAGLICEPCIKAVMA
jgi:DNA-directed RNA polymerase subunit M/transcription elongation factor TFIIS